MSKMLYLLDLLFNKNVNIKDILNTCEYIDTISRLEIMAHNDEHEKNNHKRKNLKINLKKNTLIYTVNDIHDFNNILLNASKFTTSITIQVSLNKYIQNYSYY